VFLIRQAKQDDVPTLAKLARLVYFINLPPDERIVAEKVQHSQACFRRLASGWPRGLRRVDQANASAKRRRSGGPSGFTHIEHESDMFMFVVEDTQIGEVVGTSQVRAHQGGPGSPNWSFKISERSFRSESLGLGTTHKTGQLYGDETGPTELGGLVLQPSYRGNPFRPGRLVSFVRFHLMGLHRPAFSDRIIAEMMPPVTPEGDNTFWDAFGRKFIPVKYAEADRFCQHNRKFISELLPKEEIYLTLFPLEVQNAVGVVSRETIPARRSLESLGFSYRGFVDPFDGGPHLEAQTDQVSLIKETVRTKGVTPGPGAIRRGGSSGLTPTPAIVSHLTQDGEFRAIETMIEWDGSAPAQLSREAMATLQASTGASIGITPMTKWSSHLAESSGGGAREDGQASRPPRKTKGARTAPEPAKSKPRSRKRVGA
jgi:arginine N-succinyltransferase